VFPAQFIGTTDDTQMNADNVWTRDDRDAGSRRWRARTQRLEDATSRTPPLDHQKGGVPFRGDFSFP